MDGGKKKKKHVQDQKNSSCVFRVKRETLRDRLKKERLTPPPSPLCRSSTFYTQTGECASRAHLHPPSSASTNQEGGKARRHSLQPTIMLFILLPPSPRSTSSPFYHGPLLITPPHATPCGRLRRAVSHHVSCFYGFFC